MADFKIEPRTLEDKKASEEKKSANLVWWILFACCVALTIFAVICFVWKQSRFLFDEKIDHNLFGTFGDFVGGFIGTIVAIFSVYFLVQTLRKQIDSNTETVKSNSKIIESNEKMLILNNLQLFDNQFQLLYNQYLIAVGNYQESQLIGRKALEKKVETFLGKEFDNAQEYKRRSKAAVSLFEDFYAANRVECSVHFRLLYLLVGLIAESDLDDDSRVLYAKCIRGQLSEGELAVVRYNCLTENGKKMQPFVNQFNLLKHLPLMSIFEFRKWKTLIDKDDQMSAIDTLFIALKKGMTNLNDLDDDKKYRHEISSRYHIDYWFEDTHRSFMMAVSKQKKHVTGGGVKRPLGEKALDCLDEQLLAELFYAFLHETFITGSFGLYNDKNECKIEQPNITKNDDEEYYFTINVTKNTRLVLAERQVVPGT